jgi:hypothetical protein
LVGCDSGGDEAPDQPEGFSVPVSDAEGDGKTPLMLENDSQITDFPLGVRKHRPKILNWAIEQYRIERVGDAK